MPEPRSETPKPPYSEAAGIFGQRVRQRRHELGLSQEGLAEGTSMHWSFLGRIERGQANLTLLNILRLAQVLRIDPGDLVGGLKPPEADATDPVAVPVDTRGRRADKRR